MSLQGTGPGVALYSSTDHGLSWKFQRRIGMNPGGEGRFTYAGLLFLPNSDLQLYCMHVGNNEQGDDCENKICMTTSQDGGKI